MDICGGRVPAMSVVGVHAIDSGRRDGPSWRRRTRWDRRTACGTPRLATSKSTSGCCDTTPAVMVVSDAAPPIPASTAHPSWRRHGSGGTARSSGTGTTQGRQERADAAAADPGQRFQKGRLRRRPRPRKGLTANALHVRVDVHLPHRLDPGHRAATRRSCSGRASGPTSGASSASTPTSPSSTSNRMTNCTSYCRGCRCSPTCASMSRRWRHTRQPCNTLTSNTFGHTGQPHVRRRRLGAVRRVQLAQHPLDV